MFCQNVRLQSNHVLNLPIEENTRNKLNATKKTIRHIQDVGQTREKCSRSQQINALEGGEVREQIRNGNCSDLKKTTKITNTNTVHSS